MIVFPDRILVGRMEVEGLRSAVPVRYARLATARVRGPFREKFPSRQSLIYGHNVVALIGGYGAWDAYEWQTWEGLGARIDPALVGCLRLDSAGLRPLEVDPDDPQILHSSWKVLPGGDDDAVESGKRLPRDVELLLKLGGELDRLGVTVHPHAHRRSGFVRLLAQEGKKIRGWELVAV